MNHPKSLILSTLFPFVLCPVFAQEMQMPSHDSPAVARQEFSQTVVPLHKYRIVDFEIDDATAFCLDAECRFVITNYHMEKIANPARIAGCKIVKRYSATGPDDPDATKVLMSSGPSMRFAYSRDLALFELETTVALHRGAEFSVDQLQVGQRVEIYVYPVESQFRAPSLVKFTGRFNRLTGEGLFAFDYDPNGHHRILPGSGGGIVVDCKSRKIIAVVSALAEKDTLTVFAIPAQSLVEFVDRVRPDLAERIFEPSLLRSLNLAEPYPRRCCRTFTSIVPLKMQ